MKYILLITLLLGSLTLSTVNGQESTSSTRAVIIGISDYQHNEIPDLKYAHRDAEAFAQYLSSNAGGNLDKDHLEVLTNEQATTAQFAAALDWLIDESKEGDKVIIYFSGHGDVERKTRSQLGFLLTWDSPPKMYVAGAFPIFYLQEVVSTLSLENKAKVIIITDACRSGKLARGGVRGSQLTNASLSIQFANEIKIMSCQPNEYSIEGEQWGGGRGAFSYHLVNGLYGMADKNTDFKVTLSEIDRYLEDRVTPEVAPLSQVPMTVGFKNEPLANVDEELLTAIQTDKSKQINTITKVESRGIEEEVLAKVDSMTRQKYYDWKKAVASKQFFEPRDECADDLYQILAKDPLLARLHNHMRRNYAAALQDDAQQMLNDYLYASHIEIDMPRKKRVKRYARFIKQLETAIKLLGTDHYMYNTLMGRKLFIAALHHQKSVQLDLLPEDRQKRIRLLEKSLEYEPNAAYTYFLLAERTNRDKTELGIEQSVAYSHKAMNLAPYWGKPYHTIANIYQEKGEIEKEEEMYKKALEVDPNSPYIQSRWGMFCQKHDRMEEAETAYKKAVFLDSTYVRGCLKLAGLYRIYGEKWKPNYKKAMTYYKQALALDSTYSWFYSEYAKCSYFSGFTELSDSLFQSYVQLKGEHKNKFFAAGYFYRLHSEYDLAEEYLLKALKMDSFSMPAYWELGWVHYSSNRKQEAYQLLNKIIGSPMPNPDKGDLYYLKGLFEYYEDKKEESFISFRKAEKMQSTPHTLFFNAIEKKEEGDIAEASAYFEKAMKEYPGSDNIKYIYSYLKIEQDDLDGALDLLEQALVIGGRTYDFMANDPKLGPVRELSRYKKLMQRYFPEKHDNH